MSRGFRYGLYGAGWLLGVIAVAVACIALRHALGLPQWFSASLSGLGGLVFGFSYAMWVIGREALA